MTPREDWRRQFCAMIMAFAGVMALAGQPNAAMTVALVGLAYFVIFTGNGLR